MTVTPIAFPFNPDWTNGISETLSWLTAIQVSRSDAEQREALRISPRRQLDIPLVMSGQERAYFEALLARNGGTPWYVPLPHEEVMIGPIGPGTTAFGFDTTYRSFIVGDKAIIRQDCFTCEAVDIVAVDSGGIQTSEVTLDYAAASISPAFLGIISEKVSTSRKTARVYSATARFMSLQPIDRPAAELTMVFPRQTFTVNGTEFEILTQEPNGIEDLNYDYERLFDVVDSGTSLPFYTDRAKRQLITQKYAFFLVGPQERSYFRRLLYSLRGRYAPLFVPTFNDDMAVGYGYPNPLSLSQTEVQSYRWVANFHYNGTVTVDAVEGFVGVPPETYANTDIFRRSFMTIKRLDVDDIEILHHGTLEGAATCNVIFRDAPDLRVPASYSGNAAIGSVGVSSSETALYNLVTNQTITVAP